MCELIDSFSHGYSCGTRRLLGIVFVYDGHLYLALGLSPQGFLDYNYHSTGFKLEDFICRLHFSLTAHNFLVPFCSRFMQVQAQVTALTLQRPSVSVPVLSKVTTFAPANASSTW